jgi:NADH-quinone oxidoreductase subunit L
MWVGSLALAGIPPFAGAYSKDAILDAAFADGSGIALYGWICGTAAAALTAFYSWRVIFLAFHGKPRADHHTMEHVHDSPWVMVGPLLVLGVGALFAGMALDNTFIGPNWHEFWGASIFNAPSNHVLANMEDVPFLAREAPLIMAICGIAVAYVMYVAVPTLPALLTSMFPRTYLFLLNKWYFDELYDAIFVQPVLRISRTLWQVGDTTLIDGVPNGLATLATDSSRQVVKIQTGSVAAYAFVMLIGVVVLVSVFLLLR